MLSRSLIKVARVHRMGASKLHKNSCRPQKRHSSFSFTFHSLPTFLPLSRFSPPPPLFLFANPMHLQVGLVWFGLRRGSINHTFHRARKSNCIVLFLGRLELNRGHYESRSTKASYSISQPSNRCKTCPPRTGLTRIARGYYNGVMNIRWAVL